MKAILATIGNICVHTLRIGLLLLSYLLFLNSCSKFIFIILIYFYMHVYDLLLGYPLVSIIPLSVFGL